MKRSKANLVLVALASIAAGGCEPSDRTAAIDGERLVVRGHRLSLHQIDAPDIGSARCDLEHTRGEQAKARLEALLKQASSVEFRKTGMACLQVMTCDAFVTVDGEDAGDILIAEGLAARAAVEGGGETPRDWCAE